MSKAIESYFSPVDALTRLMPELLALPLAEVQAPSMPVAVLVQESHDLLAVVRPAEIRQALLGVGLAVAHLDALPLAIEAVRESQSRWMAIRDRKKSAARHSSELAGQTLRRELAASIRWNLRDDRVALATLDAILHGNTLADLIADLAELTALIDNHRDRFASDRSFDVAAARKAASACAKQLQRELSTARVMGTQEQAKALRDRAHGYLVLQVTAIRQAGRYAFRNDAAMAAKFGSDYARARERKRQRKQQSPTRALGGGAAEPASMR